MTTMPNDVPRYVRSPWFKWSWLFVVAAVVAQSFSYHCRSLPTTAAGYSARGKADYDTGRYGDAIANLSKAIERRPEDVYSYILRGVSYAKLHEFANAKRDVEKAEELEPELDKARAAGGDVRVAAWDAEGAIREYTLALRADPNYGRCYLERGKLLYDARRWDEAAADFRRGAGMLVEETQVASQLFLWMARARGGEALGATKELVDVVNSRQVAGSYFFRMCARFLNGEMDEPTWLTTAVRIRADDADESELRAETYYVAAAKRLAFGDAAGAVPLLQEALKTDAEDSYAFDRARADLEDVLLGFRVRLVDDPEGGTCDRARAARDRTRGRCLLAGLADLGDRRCRGGHGLV
jgi:tetratricopeptide (TPR) repeat protein